MIDETRKSPRNEFAVNELRKAPQGIYLGVGSHLLPKFQVKGKTLYGAGIVVALGPRHDGRRKGVHILCDTRTENELVDALELALYCRQSDSEERYAFLGSLSESRRKLKPLRTREQERGAMAVRYEDAGLTPKKIAADSSEKALVRQEDSAARDRKKMSVGLNNLNVETKRLDDKSNASIEGTANTFHRNTYPKILDEILRLLRRYAEDESLICPIEMAVDSTKETGALNAVGSTRRKAASPDTLDMLLQLLRRRAEGDDPVVDVEIASALTSRSRSTIYRLIKLGQFPSPVRLGRTACWKMSDLERYRSGDWDGTSQSTT
jgi:predicted DNA-binding transcriptional regulator AlpA